MFELTLLQFNLIAPPSVVEIFSEKDEFLTVKVAAL